MWIRAIHARSKFDPVKTPVLSVFEFRIYHDLMRLRADTEEPSIEQMMQISPHEKSVVKFVDPRISVRDDVDRLKNRCWPPPRHDATLSVSGQEILSERWRRPVQAPSLG